jgi:hypothetical protein
VDARSKNNRVIPLTWKPVETRSEADFVVAPHERLSWARTIGIGAQHVVAMFGATFLVPPRCCSPAWAPCCSC